MARRPRELGRRLPGTIALIVGAVVFVLAISVLPYLDFGRHSTFWGLAGGRRDLLPVRVPITYTALAVAAALLAVWSWLSGSVAALAVATGAGFYLFGRVFPISASSYDGLGSGFWLAVAATVVMSAGGALALSGATLALTDAGRV